MINIFYNTLGAKSTGRSYAERNSRKLQKRTARNGRSFSDFVFFGFNSISALFTELVVVALRARRHFVLFVEFYIRAAISAAVATFAGFLTRLVNLFRHRFLL